MRCRPILVAVVLSFMAAGPIRAADPDSSKANPGGSEVLKAIPAEALGFVLINRLDKTSDKLTKMAQQLQIPAPPLLMLLKQRLGIQAGLDEAGTAAAVVMPPLKEGGPPNVAVLVPVTDYQQFVAQFNPPDPNAVVAKIALAGSPTLMAKKGRFAALMPDQPGLEQALEQFVGAAADVSGTVKPLQKWLLSNDITGTLTPDGLGRILDAADGGLDKAKTSVPPGAKEAEMVAGVMGFLQEMLQSMQKEVSHVALAIRVDDDGNLELITRALFVPAGEFARSAKDATEPEGVLAGLPAGKFVFVMGGAIPEAWAKGMTNFGIKAMKMSPQYAEMTDEQADKIAEVSKKMLAGLHSMSAMMGTIKAAEPLYNNTLALAQVDDASKYLENYKESMELMSEAVGETGPKYEVKSQKIAGFEALEVTMDLSSQMPKTGGPGDEAVKQMMEKFTGPGGKLKVYLAAIDPKTVAIAYIKPDNIQRLADAMKSGKGIADDADVAVTAALLPKGAQWTGYLSPSGLVDLTTTMVSSMMPPGTPKPQFPAMGAAPPIGATAKVMSAGLEVHVVAPSQTLTAISQYVMKFQQAMQMQMGAARRTGSAAATGSARPAETLNARLWID